MQINQIFFFYIKEIKHNTLQNLGIIKRTYGSFPNSIPLKLHYCSLKISYFYLNNTSK